MTNQADEEALRTEHRAICEQLNTDVSTEERSWSAFRDIRSNYTLEGDPLHWLCCSLYVACRQTVTPTVGNTNSVLQGNCVSLTRLLRLCNIKFIEFDSKISQWIEMASLPENQRTAINNLQHSFTVSMSIYVKYCEIFPLIFLAPNTDEPKRGKKSKPVPCSPNRLFEFIWTLFICAKAEYPEQSGDLVSSYNMLLCCLNMLYANAIADGRKDIVNPTFEGIPEGFMSGNIPEQPVCVIEALCDEGCGSNVLNTLNTSWKDVIEKFFQTNVLKGDQNSFTDLTTVGNFDDNLKSLNSLYDTFILSCGEFDERIALVQKLDSPFLARFHNQQLNPIGTPEKIPLCQQTPLTGRARIISNAECNNFTPISTANASVNKLRMKLTGYDGQPHGSLQELFRSVSRDPTTIVKSRLAGFREKFLAWMTQHKWNEKSAVAKYDMIEAVYYRLLENIVRVEQRRHHQNMIWQLCSEDMFNKTLLVCSAEIVIYAHNLQQNFSWILKAFEMPPFIFYRIIEMIILNHQDLLTRDVIKHLTIVEEQCLESLSWTSSSPLWTTMQKINYTVPTAQEVESSTDLSGITPHKPGDSAVKINDQLKNETLGPRNLNQPFASTLDFNSPLKLPVPNGSLSKRRPGESSLKLFFRKFYTIAAVRMMHLCANLNLTSLDIQKQIWTIFERSIVNFSAELMRDRHLDQMLMCAIYVFVKVRRRNITFTEIMRCYRCQPQSSSHVYRSVFMRRVNPEQEQERQQQQSGASGNRNEEGHRVNPNDLAGISVQHGEEERGDIIRFYNNVYVQLMQEFAMQFNNAEEHSLVLSPPPRGRSLMLSPRQIDARIPLYVNPMDRRNGDRKESPNSITYKFHCSPAKDLERINHIVRTPDLATCKRSLTDPDSYDPPGLVGISKRMRNGKKLDRLISDRQQQENGDSTTNQS
ncbi:retinoblastoma-like protein 2 isoform X2 [Uranotaenia lowii]|uniref:retinoblastoma-like protein 2 isoform X2 n=1 Tax=Uranotaenia lowii TaxID=190385 RepID=UPI002479FFC7|nr:retinoblastoma-like protein 2 isoform X2 [Uranotaenia lowii]